MRIDRPIIIALTLFIILILVFVLVRPEYQTFKTLQDDLGIKKAEYTAKFDYYSAISATYAQLKSKSDDVAKIDKALPSDPALGNLVYYLQEQASKSGLILRSLFLSKAANSESENTVKDLTVSLTLAGNYDALGTLMSYLENSERLFEIESISFGLGSSSRSTTKSQSQSIYSFSMQIKTHIY